MLILREELVRLCPIPSNANKRKIYDAYLDAIIDLAADGLFGQFGIETTRALRWQHLIAQWAHECGGFTLLWESGAYTAEGILRYFGEGKHSAKVTPAEAKRLAGNGYALFERVYGLGNPKKAKELGNDADGYNYRGCGIQQLTGKWAHARYAAMIGCRVDEMSDPCNSIKGALLEWRDKNCNLLADRDDVEGVRRKVNGGVNGLPDVRLHLAHAKNIWPVYASTVAASPQPVDEFPIMELGHQGQHIRQAQEWLTSAGYPVGVVDGKFGALTEQMVAAFQVQRGLLGTGKIDERTWKLLEEAEPVEHVPGRQNLDMAALEQRGDEQVSLWLKLKRRSKVVGWVASLFGADNMLGLGVVDTTLTHAERLTGVGGRLQAVMSLVSLRMIFTAVGVGLAVSLVALANKALNVQLANVKAGAVRKG